MRRCASGYRQGQATFVIALILIASPGIAPASMRSLASLSLEELGNLEVTSVSKRAERLSDAPTAVFVITAEDIRRSGATSLPEALRLAPNLHVARASAWGYAISARGFNGASANKLLVLIDGRSVYTPLFSGVFWDVQDVLLDDIERIEVISGPGGTLWGLNAVNGVINVITRSAAQTQGRLLSAGVGNQEKQLALRYGGRLGADGAWRAYAKHLRRDHTETESDAFVDDAMQHSQAGFRADWDTAHDKFSLQGDVYTGEREQPLPGSLYITGVPIALDTISVAGGHVLGRWERQLGDDSSLAVQAYYDRTERKVRPTFDEVLDILDLQVQHSRRLGGVHSVVWGAQYRYAMDDVDNGIYVEFLPGKVNHDWASVFAQDEIALSGSLRLTLGARVEHNDYTGYEFLPNARLSWKLADDQLVWASLSRPVRAPSRLDRDTYIPWPEVYPQFPGQPTYLLDGGRNVRSETAQVLELGYRGQPTVHTSLSATVFHAEYDHLRTQQIAPSGTYVFYLNGMEGTTSGIELWGAYQASPTWRLQAGYTRLWQDFAMKAGSNDTDTLPATEGANPDTRWSLRTAVDLSHDIELDATLRHVSRLSTPDVPAYTTLDLRWAWQLRPELELSVVGQNLLDGGHGEFTDPSTRSEFEPAVFVRLLSRF